MYAHGRALAKLLVYSLQNLKPSLWLSLFWFVIVYAFREADNKTLLFDV